MSVTDLASRRRQIEESKPDPHITGDAKCNRCKHEYIAVAPVGTTWLECPACETINGVFVSHIDAAVGEHVFTCNCGGQIFYITKKDGPSCHLCGTLATGWFE